MKHLIGLALEGALLTPHSPEETVRLYRAAGLESFFCSYIAKDRDTMFRIRDAADSAGMVWTSVHAPFSHANAMWKTGEDAASELAAQKETIDLAAALAVPTVVIHPFIGFGEHSPNDAGIDNFRTLLDYAGEKGILLAVENVEGIEYLDCLMEHLKGHPALRFCLDTGHEMCYNGGRDLLASYGDCLGYLHLDSNMGKLTAEGDPLSWHDDAHMLPYDGIADMNRLIRNLVRFGYTGPLTLELRRKNHEGRHTNDRYLEMSDEEYLALCVERVKRLRRELETAEKEAAH